MVYNQDRLTLESLLADPLTQLVMRSDKITPAEVEAAFEMARTGLGEAMPPRSSLSACCVDAPLPWVC